MNCLLCHKKLILPVRFDAPNELLSPSVVSCTCPKMNVLLSVDLALFAVSSMNTKYIKLFYITSFSSSEEQFKELFMFISVCCMITFFY